MALLMQKRREPVVRSVTYKLLGDLLAPAKPGDKSYGELVEVVMNHCNPTLPKTVEMFKFIQVQVHTRFKFIQDSEDPVNW